MLTIFGKKEGKDWEFITHVEAYDLHSLMQVIEDMTDKGWDYAQVVTPSGERYQPLEFRPLGATLH